MFKKSQFIKKIKSIVLFAINLFKFSYDNYVGLFYRKFCLLWFLQLDKVKIVRFLRIKYWHRIARKYHAFSPFFNSEELKAFQQNDDLPYEVREIYKHGTAIIENVLSSEEIFLLSNFIKTINIDNESDKNFIQMELPPSLNIVREKILLKLNPVYKHFFSRINFFERKQKIYVGIRIDYSIDGIDKSPNTANWHIDRFVPTINAIYFPFGVNWGPFEKDFGSPLITEQDVNYYLQAPRDISNTLGENRDNLYVIMKERNKKKFFLGENQMIVGSHHMQHRRSPIESPGKRIGIFIDNYNYFTRNDLF